MTFEEYQKEAVKFRTETANNEEYLTLGLIAEVGEVADKLAKRRRDGVFDEKAFIKELGDVLWFVANLADYWDKKYGGLLILTALKNSFVDIYECDYAFKHTHALAYWASAVVYGERDADEGLCEIVYNLATLAELNGYDIEQVAEINLAKLRDRQARGVIQGNGDER